MENRKTIKASELYKKLCAQQDAQAQNIAHHAQQPLQNNNNPQIADNPKHPANPGFAANSQNTINPTMAQNPVTFQKRISPMTKLLRALSLAVIILLFLLVFAIIFGFSFWLNTYKAFTKETPVAKITVSPLAGDPAKDPKFKLEYTEIPRQTAFTQIFNGDETPDASSATYEYDINGDRFAVEAEVVVLDNWAYLFNPGRLIGTDMVYKMSRIKGDYSDLKLARSGPYSVYDLNGGVDDFWKWMELNQEKLPFVKSVHGSAVIEFVRDKESEWSVYMTEDGLGLRLAE